VLFSLSGGGKEICIVYVYVPTEELDQNLEMLVEWNAMSQDSTKPMPRALRKKLLQLANEIRRLPFHEMGVALF
jgi:hypothetical protein